VPEGLSAVLALTLIFAASMMKKDNLYVRKLYSLETLGLVKEVCTDKTGTLTKNEMTVKWF